MTLNEIYSKYTIGSAGFIGAIQTHCCFDCSDDEINRIAVISPTAEAFQRNWENDDSWADA